MADFKRSGYAFCLGLKTGHFFTIRNFPPFSANDKTDSDVLRENHRFLWRDEDEEDMTW